MAMQMALQMAMTNAVHGHGNGDDKETALI
jgi:hypothetical protein